MIAHILALVGNVVLWVGYIFAALFFALLVYAASQGGTDVTTTAITLAVCAAAVATGLLGRYILAGNRKA
jgi:hypothetical protein